MSRNRSNIDKEEMTITRHRVLPVGRLLLPYATPWMIGFATLPLGALLHWKASSPLMMAVITACAGALTWSVYRLWDRRHTYTQRLATVYTGTFGLWLLGAAAVGVIPVLTPWAVVWVMTSLLWNVRLGSITVTNKHDKIAGEPETAWGPIKALKGVRTKKAALVSDESGQKKVEIRIQHPAGQSTTSDVQTVRDNVAGRFAVGPDDVSVRPVPGRADQTDIIVRTDKPTKRVLTWHGPYAAGKSIADAPVRIGVRASGQPFAFWIVGDDAESRPLPHTIVSGMNGSGKSEAMIIADLEIRARTDALSVVANPVKFQIDFGDIADLYPIAAEGEQQTRQLIDNLPEAGEYRAWVLGRLGYKQWEPECYTKHGIPLVFIRIEEAASVLAGSKPFKRATETFRALGMPLCASMQVAVFRNIDREARSQFGNSLAFGVADMQDAKFVLTGDTLSAGADPTAWKNNQPGRLYGELTGFPPELWPEDARVERASREAKRAAIEATKPHWAVLDAGTALRLGKGIERPDSTVTATLAGLGQFGRPVGDMPGHRPDTVPAFTVVRGGSADGTGAERMPTEDAREMVEARICDLERERPDGIVSARDFDDLVTVIGRKTTWIYYELDRWAKRGRLEVIDGPGRRWKIIPSAQAADG